MIKYSLRCEKEHVFEAWFRDSAAFDAQSAAGHLSCPSCGSHEIQKAIMAPRLGKARAEQAPAEVLGEDRGTAPAAVMAPSGNDEAAELRRALQVIRRQVEDNCDYVGSEFANEARRIHKGESEARGIYGEASDAQAKELNDEGIEVARIPWVPREDA